MGNSQDHKKEKKKYTNENEDEKKAAKADSEKHKDARIEATGQLTLDENESDIICI